MAGDQGEQGCTRRGVLSVAGGMLLGLAGCKKSREAANRGNHRRGAKQSFAAVRRELLPVVRSRFYLESIILRSRIRGDDVVAVPNQLIGDHLALLLVHNLPQAIRDITQDDLDQWDIKFLDAMAMACHNLEQLGNASFVSLKGEGGEEVYVFDTGDNYDASRFALLDMIRRLTVRGDHIAMVSNSNTLVVTGSEDTAGLMRMCEIGAESFDKPEPISTIAFHLVGDQWNPWLPDLASPAFARFHDLRLRTIGQEYNDQKGLLDEIHKLKKEDIFVASFSAVKNKATGNVTSYSTWSEGVPTLLPETEDIVLLKTGPAPEKVALAAAGSFVRVRETVGDLMQPMGLHPERYRVLKFPTAQQLVAIGKGDLPQP